MLRKELQMIYQFKCFAKVLKAPLENKIWIALRVNTVEKNCSDLHQ